MNETHLHRRENTCRPSKITMKLKYFERKLSVGENHFLYFTFIKTNCTTKKEKREKTLR